MEQRVLSGEDIDSLTDIFNRPAFNARLEFALRTASPEQPLSVLHLDLDDFMKVNANYGHPAGDHVLHYIAGLLPTGDGVVPARGGGDEFWLIVPGLDETASLLYAGRLCEILSNHPTKYNGCEIVVTASIGVSTTEGPVAAAVISEQANSALYAAKGGGRNRGMHFRALERAVVHAGGDVRVETFETMQRVVSERATEFIAQRRRQLFKALQ